MPVKDLVARLNGSSAPTPVSGGAQNRKIGGGGIAPTSKISDSTPTPNVGGGGIAPTPKIGGKALVGDSIFCKVIDLRSMSPTDSTISEISCSSSSTVTAASMLKVPAKHLLSSRDPFKVWCIRGLDCPGNGVTDPYQAHLKHGAIHPSVPELHQYVDKLMKKIANQNTVVAINFANVYNPTILLDPELLDMWKSRLHESIDVQIGLMAKKEKFCIRWGLKI